MKSRISAVLVLVVFALSLTASAQPPAIKNVVLVHGAFADGSSYAKVIPLLVAKGLNVVAVQNPLTSLADDVAATKRAIATMDGPVVLVGHSWGGMVISEAGNDPNVAAIVYIAALVPTNGQSTNDVLKPYPPTPGLSAINADASGFLKLTRAGIADAFVPDLPAAERELVYVTQGAWNSTALNDKVASPAWKSKPSWYIVVDDRMVPAEFEKAIAKHIGATTTNITAGHVPMLSKPKEVAAVILDAANKAGTTSIARATNARQ